MSEDDVAPERRVRRGAGLAVARTAIRVPGDLVLALVDCFVIVTTYTLLLVFRFEFSVPDEYWNRLWVFLPVALVVHLTANRLWHTYGHMWQHASVEEARRLLLAGLSSEIVLLAFFVGLSHYRMPLSVILVGPLLATIVMGAVRFQSRLFAFRRADELGPGLRVAVVGAGTSGAAAVREMRRDPHLGLTPVVVVDDEARIHGKSLNGVPITGGIDDLEPIVREYEAHQILLAIANAPSDVAEQVAAAATAVGIPVKVMPRLADLVEGRVSLRDVRDLRIEDLLGREQVEVDFEQVRDLLRDRRVLVTGGGGSIGGEIARQVASFQPAALAILDHDETHLHEAAENLPPGTTQVLADIRDPIVVQQVFDRVRPEVVFHAAAHKHVPILEAHACEAAATNVVGTANVVDAAVRSGVERLVCISTDKAAQPTSVMGASKWVAEQIVLERTPPGRQFCSVRFGNVLGSRGSVIPTFQRQIAAGGPVTVTDRRMTRFFMSTREAVSLVLQAGADPDDQGVLMLEMGQPVNILTLAERMIRLCGYEVDDIGIEFTGVRPGESLVEELHGRGEVVEPTAHPAIVAVLPVSLTPGTLDDALRELADFVALGDDEGARDRLRSLASNDAGAEPAPATVRRRRAQSASSEALPRRR